MKSLLMKKKLREVARNAVVTLNPLQLQEVGLSVGDNVEVYVKGKKIIIEKLED